MHYGVSLKMNLPAKLKKFLGDEKYFKFLNSLHNACIEKQRLMFWQENALKEFSNLHTFRFSSVSDLVELFPYEEAQLPTIEETSNQWLLYLREHGIREWDERMEISRYVRKIGDLSSDEPTLILMAPYMTKDEIHELRQEVHKSGRPEEEWSPSFNKIFGQYA